MKNSIWAVNTQLPNFPPVEQDFKTDVLIVGGGVAGILCAHRLEQNGVDYALIEADRICAGVTRNTTAKITSQHGLIYHKLLGRFGQERTYLYWKANEEALRQYRALAKTVSCDFEEKDHYIYSLTSKRKLDRELEALQQIGIRAEFADQLELPFSTAGAVRFSGQAQFHPLKFVSDIARGLNIYEHTPARAFVGNTVLTDRGKITASKIIIATHFPILNKHGSYFAKMYQDRSYVLALDNAPQVSGMYLDEADTGLSFRGYKNHLLIGGGAHRTGKQGSGWSDLEAAAKRYYPNAGESCRWAAQDCVTLDDVAYIGRYSKRTPNLYVATGFNKWGMTSSMVAAMILSDLVREKENPFTQVFSPSRSVLHPRLVSNICESAVNLITPTVPRCPHLGCALKWNPYEHSWDCPCHGSRFEEDGQLLDNPATGNLKKDSRK